jgi:hypothetical protein
MTKEILHTKRRKSTPKEDFGIEDEQIDEPIESAPKVKQQFEDLGLLDVFALVVSPGVASRVNDPKMVAAESYAIGRAMIAFSNLE